MNTNKTKHGVSDYRQKSGQSTHASSYLCYLSPSVEALGRYRMNHHTKEATDAAESNRYIEILEDMQCKLSGGVRHTSGDMARQ